jgi:hypothetical protein
MSEAQLPKASSARVRKQAAAALLSLLAWAERQNFNLPADLYDFRVIKRTSNTSGKFVAVFSYGAATIRRGYVL